MIESKWRRYVGLATTAILNNNDRILEVYCPEFMPTKDGKMTAADAKPQKKKMTVKSVLGQNYTADIAVAPTIKCEYLGTSTNHDVPDIHIGEQVRVHNYAGMEKFYWTPLGRDDNLRRVEHYKVKIADQQKTVKELTDDNTYLFEMDTRNGKLIRLKTSWSDGEEYIYQFHIDAKANKVTMWDTNKAGLMNICTIDSNIPLIRAVNRNKTFFELRADDINMYAPGNFTGVIDKNATVTIKGNLTCNVIGNAIFSYAANVTISIAQTLKETFTAWTASVANKLAITAKKAIIADSKGNTLHKP